MSINTERKQAISRHIQEFANSPLREASLSLFTALGYESDRTIESSSVADFREQFDPDAKLEHPAALIESWQSAELLFQLTDEELSRSTKLFKDESVKTSLLQSYVFIAIELAEGDYARGKLAGIARQINRIFPMPVMVLFRIGARLSIAVINRRLNKHDNSKDVLGKVTLIQDISIGKPHPGHLDILGSFSLAELSEGRRSIQNFDQLHASWEEVFNVELLSKRFYRELANWYFWALPQVEFPADIEKDDEKRRATSVIRLLTRLIFCWFLKEKGLVPEKLFVESELKSILKDLSPDSCSYNEAILQNLFFATLNQRMGKDKDRNPYRAFAKDEEFIKNRTAYGDTLYRYEDQFRDPDCALDHFAEVPFLNGGLFECLDRTEEDTNRKLYLDGFSRNKMKRPIIPNRLFFGTECEEDLSEAYGDKKRKKEKVRGLLHILNSYKFTIVENTPIDQEIALDPELLGKVFENLLASYNEETKTTARKQTGSFYTPRPIVEYMVDESLKAHLKDVLVKTGISEVDAKAGLTTLFAYTDSPHPFNEDDTETLLAAIHSCKILDPACGSGAFPMGMLHKLVYIIHKLDPDNSKWKQLQIDAALSIPDNSAREVAIAAIERDFSDNEDDYGRKLYLIENCLYGVDIQPVAIQISKLRFFISLVCDQRINRNKSDNLGIRPLPNLETKFVAANTLFHLKQEQAQFGFHDPKTKKLETDLQRIRHDHFSVTTRQKKLSLQRKDRVIRDKLASELRQAAFWDQTTALKLASWDPYDTQMSADFFEPVWMFDKSVSDGFDIVIGNPPYGASISNEDKKLILDSYFHQDYQLDTYLLFIERGMALLNSNGVQSVIIPNTWLSSLMFKSVRRFLFGETRLINLVDVKTKVFSAIVNNNILIHRKGVGDNTFPVGSYTDSGFEFSHMQNQREWYSEDGRVVSVALTPQLKSIASKILNYPPLESFFTITPGCKPYQVGKGFPKQTRETVDNKPFTSEKKEDHLFRPLLRGRLINRYEINWDYDLWIKFGEWLAEPRLTANYEAPKKIVIRQTGDSLIAASDNQQFIVMNNMFTVVPKSTEAPLGFALAAINSSVLNWFYQTCVNPEKGEAMAEVKKGHLTGLPIAIPTSPNLEVFSMLTELIATAKRNNELSISSFLDDLIDACVMECYFLEHMSERDLTFLEELHPYLVTWNAETGEAKQRDLLINLHSTLNAPDSKIRNRLLRLTADSPDLLAIIKGGGRV